MLWDQPYKILENDYSEITVDYLNEITVQFKDDTEPLRLFSALYSYVSIDINNRKS
jgi:hypothetical protein